jgi:hypothetical protein
MVSKKEIERMMEAIYPEFRKTHGYLPNVKLKGTIRFSILYLGRARASIFFRVWEGAA